MTGWIQETLNDVLSSGSIWVYGLLFVSGVLASFTPCTYPVLPLTVGYVGGMAGGRRLKSFLMSVSLVFGMALVYAVAGTVFAAVGGQFGSVWSSGWAMYVIAMFFLLMSLFLLDVFTFPSTGFLDSLRVRVGQKYQGLGGAFIVGGVSGLVVGPCTGPILAVVIGVVAVSLRESHGIEFWYQAFSGGLKFFVFGLGQGTLIVLAGTFAGFLSALPKSGQWLVAVKKGFALMVMAGASLLLVYVGQGTDFPELTRLLAVAESPQSLGRSDPRDRGGAGEDKISEEREEKQPESEKQAAEPPSEKIAESRREQAPDFLLSLLGGGTFRLSDNRGKRGTVLIFFATWCPNCMAEVPTIKKFAERVKDKSIDVLAVNYKQPERIVQKFKNSYETNYKILLDTDGKVTTQYGVVGIPHIVGIDVTGMRQYEGTHLPGDLEGFIKGLLEGKRDGIK